MATQTPVDFLVSNQGTIYILSPFTPAAEAWLAENIGDDAQTWGRGIVVEHRYIGDIVEGIQADGFGCPLGPEFHLTMCRRLRTRCAKATLLES